MASGSQLSPRPPALRAWSLSHWTSRKVPSWSPKRNGIGLPTLSFPAVYFPRVLDMSHVNHESWTFLFMPLILDFVRFSSVILTGRDITGSLPIILAYSFFFALLLLFILIKKKFFFIFYFLYCSGFCHTLN